MVQFQNGRLSLPFIRGSVDAVFLALSILVVYLVGERSRNVDMGEVTLVARLLLACKDGRIARSFSFQPLAEVNSGEVDKGVRIEDLYNDGRKEVLVAAPLLLEDRDDSSSDAFYCFSRDGKELLTCPPKTGPVKMRVLPGYKPERRTEDEAESIQRGADHWGVEGG